MACDISRGADGSVLFMCGSDEAAPPCSICKSREATKLCDYPLAKSGKTCDRNLCDDLTDFMHALNASAEEMRVARLVRLIFDHRAVGGHPETLAALTAEPRWAETFPGIRLVPMPHAEKGDLYAGTLISDIADGAERADMARGVEALLRWLLS